MNRFLLKSGQHNFINSLTFKHLYFKKQLGAWSMKIFIVFWSKKLFPFGPFTNKRHTRKFRVAFSYFRNNGFFITYNFFLSHIVRLATNCVSDIFVITKYDVQPHILHYALATFIYECNLLIGRAWQELQLKMWVLN